MNLELVIRVTSFGAHFSGKMKPEKLHLSPRGRGRINQELTRETVNLLNPCRVERMTSMKLTGRLYILIFAICMFAGPAGVSLGAQDAQDVLRVGIFPLFSSRTLIEIFAPFQEYLSANLDQEVRIVSAPDRESFNRRSVEGSYDLVYTCNSCYLEIRKEAGFRAVATGFPDLRGVVMVKDDGPIWRLEQLEGKRMVAVSPQSIAGYLFLRSMLADLNLFPGRDYQLDFNQNVEAQPFLVLNGHYDAAVFSEDTYVQSPIYESTVGSLRILASSMPIPRFPFAVHPDLDDQLATEITRLILALDRESPWGREFLQALNIQGFKAVEDPDFTEFSRLFESLSSSPDTGTSQ